MCIDNSKDNLPSVPESMGASPEPVQTVDLDGLAIDPEVMAFIIFLRKEEKDNCSLAPVQEDSPSWSKNSMFRQKLGAIQNVLKRGQGPTYNFVKSHLVGQRGARRKSTFIEKNNDKFPQASFLGDLIKKFLFANVSRRPSRLSLRRRGSRRSRRSTRTSIGSKKSTGRKNSRRVSFVKGGRKSRKSR